MSGSTPFDQVCRRIDADLYEQAQKVLKLYNPYRNLYLDQCCSESKHPLGEWMDLSKYREKQNPRPAAVLRGGGFFHLSLIFPLYFRTKRIPKVWGPQWQETVHPA